MPEELSFVTGTVGLLGSKPSSDLIERCDTLLMIGAGLSYAEFLAAEGQARGVQIDPDPRLLSPGMEVGLVGDCKATLAALLPYLEHKPDRRFRQQIERDVARWWQVLGLRAMAEAEPINPERVFSELSPRLPENCIVTCDAGSAPTGSRATCGCDAACRRRCRAGSRASARRCRMRSPRSTRSRSGR